MAVSNNTDFGRSVRLKLTEHKGLDLLAGKTEDTFDLTRDSRARRMFSLRPKSGEDKAQVRVEGTTEPLAIDAVLETIRVVPDGFPVAGSSSDLLEKSATHKVQLPGWLPLRWEPALLGVLVVLQRLAQLPADLLARLARSPEGRRAIQRRTRLINGVLLVWRQYLSYLDVKRYADRLEESERHFRELDTDIRSTDFTVVGIGDMSGDVFGNGMLLSQHIRLVAAFDHRHVFVDPDPDPAASFAERRRLFELPRSSWAACRSRSTRSPPPPSPPRPSPR